MRDSRAFVFDIVLGWRYITMALKYLRERHSRP